MKNRTTINENMIFGKVPPQAIEIEQAVIGACLLEPDTFERVMEIIPYPECFYFDKHQSIYKAICQLYAAGNKIDILTVTEQLRKENTLDLVGGPYAITQLTMSVLSSAHVQNHALLVMEKFMRRELITVGAKMMANSYDDSCDVLELLTEGESAVKRISDGILTDSALTVQETFLKVREEYENQKKSNSKITGVPSGFDSVDAMTGGWKSPSLIIIGGRPSQGKTAFMLDLVMNAATSEVPYTVDPTQKAKNCCKIYSLETGGTNLTRRMTANIADIPFPALNEGTLTQYQEELFKNAYKHFNRMSIEISTTLHYIEDIERDIRRKKKRNKYFTLAAIDFIQLIGMRNPDGRNKAEIVGHVSRRLKLLSAELNMPIIVLSQLNREAVKNEGKRPGSENLANSTELEQNADVIALIWWKPSGQKDAYGKDEMEPVLIMAKNKDGKCGDIPMKFDGNKQRWSDKDSVTANMDDYSIPSGITAQYWQEDKPNLDLPF